VPVCACPLCVFVVPVRCVCACVSVCVFVGSIVPRVFVLGCIRRPLALSLASYYPFFLLLTHSPTRSLTHSPTHPLTHPLTHSPAHSPTHSPTHSLTHSPTHPLTHPLTHPPTHSLTRSLTHSLTITATATTTTSRRGHLHARGPQRVHCCVREIRPGLPQGE
jgi:hypothetical protein